MQRSLSAVASPRIRSAFLASRRFRSEALLDEGVNSYGQRIGDGIGKGTVIPLKYNYLRPHYNTPTHTTQFFTLWIWFQWNCNGMIACAATIALAYHGFFTGHLPPDPHSLFN